LGRKQDNTSSSKTLPGGRQQRQPHQQQHQQQQQQQQLLSDRPQAEQHAVRARAIPQEHLHLPLGITTRGPSRGCPAVDMAAARMPAHQRLHWPVVWRLCEILSLLLLLLAPGTAEEAGYVSGRPESAGSAPAPDVGRLVDAGIMAGQGLYEMQFNGTWTQPTRLRYARYGSPAPPRAHTLTNTCTCPHTLSHTQSTNTHTSQTPHRVCLLPDVVLSRVPISNVKPWSSRCIS